MFIAKQLNFMEIKAILNFILSISKSELEIKKAR